MLVARTKARKTGTYVLVLDNRTRDEFDEEQPWFTVCEEHHTLVGHATRRAAASWAVDPGGWCDDCAQEAT